MELKTLNALLCLLMWLQIIKNFFQKRKMKRIAEENRILKLQLEYRNKP